MIAKTIRDVPDFPKKGIVFKDITPLLADPTAFVASLDVLAERYASDRPDVIVGVESRGFIFGAALAARMTASFVPVRKAGKLPWDSVSMEYELEYGTDVIEMHVDAFPKGAKVLVIDDLIATGGTAWATCELVKQQGGELLGAAFVVELGFLKGRERLAGVDVFSVLTY
ncbi:MAG: adenine phosphoribosyltransferase [Deltaproteobacteria bacterium]|nr:MAG: adenine phosphoribosyltransferase [Deltaproteobacteria bacterium]